jgi:hypothetical protein
MASFPTTPTIGQTFISGSIMYTWNGIAWKASTITYIDSLADVDTSTVLPIVNNTLKWNGTNWIPGVATAVSSINDLVDVKASGAVVNDSLIFNGTDWVPAVSGITSLATLSDTSGVNSALTGDILYFNGSKWIPSRTDLDHTLDELLDVVVSGAVTNDILKFNGTNWIPGTVTVPSILDDLSDVVVSGVASGDTIVFNGTNWVPIVSGLSSLPAISFDNLSDVVVSGAAVGDLVIFNGTDWVPITSGTFAASSLSFDSLSDVVVSGAAVGNTIVFDGTNWIPIVSGGSSNVSTFDSLSDVVVSGAVTGNTVVFDGTNWVPAASGGGSSYLSTLLDVDITTVPPASGSSLVYNAVTNKWETNLNSITQSSISFTSTNPPAFSSVVPGTVWIDDATLDQYIYIQDSSGTPQWVSLGSSGASYLSTLLDVNVSGNTTNSALVFDGTTWVPKILTTSSPVVSGTDSGRAPILDFSGKLDDSTLPTSVTKSVNGNNPDPLGNVTVSLATVLTGTLGTRPTTSANGDVYIVSGDTAANNGRTFIYKASNTTWFEVNSLGGLSTTELKVVAPGGSNITGVGTFSSPWQTIQFAINQINFGVAANIIILPGTYTENLTVSTHLNLTIGGLKGAEGSYPVIINGSITTSGTATRLRVMDLTIAGTVANPVPYLDTGSTGRHVFESVQFIPYTTSNCVTFSGTSKNFFGFYDCTFGGTGAVNMGSGTPSTGALAFFTRPTSLYALSIPNLWSGGIAITDAEIFGLTSHVASPLLIQDVRNIAVFNSTATSLNGALYVDTSSMFVKALGTYTVVNKTGNAPYRFRNFEMARSGNTINGSEINTTARIDWTNLNQLRDVDLITTPPITNNVLKYNGTSWVPGSVAGAALIWQTATPAFTGLTPGQIWIKSDTLEQSIYVVDDSGANVWLTLGTAAASINLDLLRPNRNILVNSSGKISQRWCSNTIGLTNTADFPADRWRARSTQSSKLTAGRNYSNPNFPDDFTNCIGFKTTSAATVASGDVCIAEQYIEGYRLQGLQWGSANAKQLTISFWLYTNISGTYSFSLRKIYSLGTVFWSYIKDVTHGGTGWQYFTFTVPANTSSPSSANWNYNSTSCQLIFGFNLGSGSTLSTATTDTWQNNNFVRSTTSRQVIATLNHTFCITGVQMEIGGTVSEYEDIPYNQEFDNCQTYFQKTYLHDVPIASNSVFGANVFRPHDSQPSLMVPFRKSFLSSPVISIIPTAGGIANVGKFTNGTGDVTGAVYNISENSFVFNGIGNAIAGNNNEFHWWASADPTTI